MVDQSPPRSDARSAELAGSRRNTGDPDPDDVIEAPRFTLRHLRAGDDACARRIAREVVQQRTTVRNRSSTRAFDLAARIIADIAVAHTELRSATIADFPNPTDLSLEERRVHRAAALGYLARFDEPFVVDSLADEWETADSATGHRWIARVPLAGHDATGTARIRHLLVDGRPEIDAPTLFMLALRTDGWADDVLVDVGALLSADRGTPLVIDKRCRDEARAWARERAAHCLAIADAGRARAGRDCLGCAFVAGCPPHS